MTTLGLRLKRRETVSVPSGGNPASGAGAGAGGEVEEVDQLQAVYQWGMEEIRRPSLAHLLGLSCRRVKLISCSSHFLVVTQEPGGGELLWTWGSNDAGQCGVGEELGCESKGGQLRPIPYLSTAQIAMRSPQPISAVACSRSASLVLRSSGVLLWCGSLPSPSPHRPQMSFTSVSVHQGDIRSICAGEAHLAAVVETAEGSRQVVTWGLNTHGQLGHGKALNTFVGSPTAVAFAWPSPVVQVCSGARHMLALLQNGRVYAWGKNVHTSIADTVPVEKKPRILGTRAQEMALMAPTKVVLGHAKSTLKGCISERLPVVMTASDSFSVISTPKKSWSWGECRYGGLGHGPQVFYVPSPSTPHLYPDNIVDITCGSRHTLFLDSSKRLYAMGYGRHGSLGVELSSSALSTPTLVTTFSNVPFQVSMMAAGESASLALMNLEPNPELTALFTPDSHLRFSDLVAPPSSAPPSPASSSSLASLSTSSSSSSSSSPPNATDAELIPSIVSQTLDYLEADSARISYEGIFRVEGLAQEKKIIERLWQTGEPLADFPDQYLSVPNLTFALKSFFRALPPLIPFDDFELFFQAASRSNVHDRVFSLGQRARQLPPGHWAILRRLYLHGMIVIANEPRNRMNLEAVSRMWGNMTLRNPDQSDKGLMRQGEVGAVAKPLLAYGHIIFDDFLWSLYLALYVSVGGESALAICDLLAKETRSPQDEAEWLRQLTTPRTGPTTTPDLPAMEQELAGFQGRLQALKDAACASATGQQLIAHITEAFELFDGIDTLLFSEQTHLIFWIVSVVLRSLRSTMWNVPVRHTRRTFRREGTLPHPISKMNFNFLGEDPFSTCVRALQALVHEETELEKRILELEQQHHDLWQHCIDPLLLQYQELSFFRQLKIEELIMQKVWPTLVNHLPYHTLCSSLESLAGDGVLRLILDHLWSFARLPDCPHSNLKALLTRARLCSSTLKGVQMLKILAEIDQIEAFARIPSSITRWSPSPEQLLTLNAPSSSPIVHTHPSESAFASLHDAVPSTRSRSPSFASKHRVAVVESPLRPNSPLHRVPSFPAPMRPPSPNALPPTVPPVNACPLSAPPIPTSSLSPRPHPEVLHPLSLSNPQHSRLPHLPPPPLRPPPLPPTQ